MVKRATPNIAPEVAIPQLTEQIINLDDLKNPSRNKNLDGGQFAGLEVSPQHDRNAFRPSNGPSSLYEVAATAARGKLFEHRMLPLGDLLHVVRGVGGVIVIITLLGQHLHRVLTRYSRSGLCSIQCHGDGDHGAVLQRIGQVVVAGH